MHNLDFELLKLFYKIVVGLDDDDVQLFLKHHHLNFVTYETCSCNYSIEDISEIV